MKHTKPNYIAEDDLIATEKGWENKHTGEILVAIPNLKEKLKKRRGRPKNKK